MANENLWRKCFVCGLPPVDMNLVLELIPEKKYIHHLCMQNPTQMLKDHGLLKGTKPKPSLYELI